MIRILRQLSAIFLTFATAFAVVAGFSQHPDWQRAARQVAEAANVRLVQPGVAYAQAKGDDLYHWANNQISPPAQVARQETPKRRPAQVAKQQPAPPLPQIARQEPVLPPTEAPQVPAAEPAPVPAPVIVANNAPVPPVKRKVRAPDIADTSRVLRPAVTDDDKPAATAPTVVASAKHVLQLAPPPPQDDVRPLVSRAAPGPGELVRVAERLKSSLSPDLLTNFDLFLYVSKADTGSWAQRMYVFAKQPGGNLDMLYNWPVSTGRDAWELDVHGKKQNSFTPQGYYQLDPQRMHVKYHSGQWNQPMPYAMFFNWEKGGYQTGLAIHAATGEDISLLGQRASAGCVRLAPENARLLFNLIRSQYKGLAPKFAYDKRTATMDNNGLLLHDKNGKIVFDNGYKVLVFVENYGGNDVVAALF